MLSSISKEEEIRIFLPYSNFPEQLRVGENGNTQACALKKEVRACEAMLSYRFLS